MRKPSPVLMYCSLMALNSSWPAVSSTAEMEGHKLWHKDLLEELDGERALPDATIPHHHQLVRWQVVTWQGAGCHGYLDSGGEGNSCQLAAVHPFLPSTMEGRKMFPSLPKTSPPTSQPARAKNFQDKFLAIKCQSKRLRHNVTTVDGF
ncbi:hypothetical protein EYF80_017706 [Liparis tanakae]|uniref:Uncharacterized protein n=1 Tax=Liparis tanakae TaxID=230148 RepID=A0A4Z2I217_9TELE|nr:hypothetical protein EYF80_017706 [Liparis tanakae]